MAKNSKWQNEYWLLLMETYLQEPVGIKSMYSRQMVNLSLELHIQPEALFNKMSQIANLETPRIERIWEDYGHHPKKLARAASLLRSMKGFNKAEEFYEGVEMNESFEKDFRPIDGCEPLTPMMLILILDQYFRLTPNTMVEETPETQELASLMEIAPEKIVEVMDVFQHCDPYLRRKDTISSPLLKPCQQIWRRFGNGDTKQLASFASQLKDYFIK